MRNMKCELIGPRKLEYYINNPYSYIIDIRSKEMYDSGHIKGAENYPYDYLSSYEGIRAFKSQYRDKSAIYVLYCETGTNSLLVCNKLALYGYIVKSLAGGIRGYNGRYLQLKL